jgi:hypothetical protein
MGQYPPFQKTAFRIYFFKQGNLQQNIPFSEKCVTFWQVFAPQKKLV